MTKLIKKYLKSEFSHAIMYLQARQTAELVKSEKGDGHSPKAFASQYIKSSRFPQKPTWNN